jgi:hypothetical protein
MPIIPTRSPQAVATPQAALSDPKQARFAGEKIARAGDLIQKTGKTVGKYMIAKERSQAASAKIKAAFAARKAGSEAEDAALRANIETDGENLVSDYNKVYDKAAKTYMKGLQGSALTAAQNEFSAVKTGQGESLTDTARAMFLQKTSEDLLAIRAEASSHLLSNPDDYFTSIAQFDDSAAEMMLLNPEQEKKFALQSKQTLVTSAVSGFVRQGRFNEARALVSIESAAFGIGQGLSKDQKFKTADAMLKEITSREYASYAADRARENQHDRRVKEDVKQAKESTYLRQLENGDKVFLSKDPAQLDAYLDGLKFDEQLGNLSKAQVKYLTGKAKGTAIEIDDDQLFNKYNNMINKNAIKFSEIEKQYHASAEKGDLTWDRATKLDNKIRAARRAAKRGKGGGAADRDAKKRSREFIESVVKVKGFGSFLTKNAEQRKVNVYERRDQLHSLGTPWGEAARIAVRELVGNLAAEPLAPKIAPELQSSFRGLLKATAQANLRYQRDNDKKLLIRTQKILNARKKALELDLELKRSGNAPSGESK